MIYVQKDIFKHFVQNLFFIFGRLCFKIWAHIYRVQLWYSLFLLSGSRSDKIHFLLSSGGRIRPNWFKVSTTVRSTRYWFSPNQTSVCLLRCFCLSDELSHGYSSHVWSLNQPGIWKIFRFPFPVVTLGCTRSVLETRPEYQSTEAPEYRSTLLHWFAGDLCQEVGPQRSSSGTGTHVGATQQENRWAFVSHKKYLLG